MRNRSKVAILVAAIAAFTLVASTEAVGLFGNNNEATASGDGSFAAATQIDAAAKLKVDDKIDTKDKKQKVYVEVRNLGTGKLTVDPNTEVSLDVLVNGSPVGSVVLKSRKSKTLKPGKKKKFKFYWYPEGALECGDSVEYTGTVSVAGDSMPGNDSDSETVTVSSKKKKKGGCGNGDYGEDHHHGGSHHH